MADLVSNVVVGAIFDNLISLLNKEIESVRNINKQVDKLLTTLTTIQSVLEDAEEKQIKSKPIALWLTQLKDASYDAEDILDAWSIGIKQHGLDDSNKGCWGQVSSWLNVKSIMFRCKIAKQVQEISSKFNDIAKLKSDYGLNVNAESSTQSQNYKERETSSGMIEPHIYGRDVDREKIIGILVNDASNQHDVSILPIVGMGGLGKTTLVQSVYNDDKVKSYFQKKIWVCVSEPFEVKRILKAIIEDSKRKRCDLEFLEPIRKEVAEILKDEKYLLVLDDLWNEDEEEWKKLKCFLRGGAKGSTIIITTRIKKVASFTGTLSTYHLEGLSPNDCWSVLKDCAFGSENVERPNLVEIGKAIAEKCKGVPLAAKSLGSLLGSKTNEQQWKQVRDSDIWNLNEGGENTILPILRLSYNQLPSRLKQCFAYCSIFPKDWVIQRRRLIYLWMANGYIQSQPGQELEEIGDDVFMELLSLSFFQEAKEDGYGNIESCKMHDLMHDLSCSIARNECFVVKDGEGKDVPGKIRHLNVCSGSSHTSNNIYALLTSQSSLRSLVFLCQIDFFRFEFCSTLRVLDLTSMKVETLPPSVCKLKHLRYLDLFNTGMKCLPESIGKLRNLQFLDLSLNGEMTTLPYSIGDLKCLRYLALSSCDSITILPQSIGNLEHLRYLNLFNCERLEALPESMRNMSSLRHLDIKRCDRLSKMPVGIGQLTRLETLRGAFIVGRASDGENGGGGGIAELQGLNQLRGRLVIKGLENVTNPADAKEAKLGSKEFVTKLTLVYDEESVPEINKNIENVLQGLELPPNIKKLKIIGWETCFAEGFLGNLNALRCLEIMDCQRVVCLPGGMEKLTSLERESIKGCKSIKCLPAIGMQGVNTSSLAELEISYCDSLTSVSEGLQHLTSLKELSIRSSPKLVFGEDDFQNLISLRNLSLRDLPNVTAVPESVQNLTMLRSLYMRYCSNVIRLPEGMKHLTSLVDLQLWDLPKLTSLPELMQHLTMLQTLEIENLPMLPESVQNLTMLRSLHICNCSNVIRLPEGMKHLTSLVHLRLWDLPKLTASPPEWMQHLTMLQSLEISNLPMLPEWLQHLPSSLQQLRISNFCSTKSLPVMGMLEGSNASSLVELTILNCDNLTSLSEGLRYLTSLKELYITNCPHLELEAHDFHNLISLQSLSLWSLPLSRGNSIPSEASTTGYLELREPANIATMDQTPHHSSISNN